MNCYYHNEIPAVINCQWCGKGLCAECSSVIDVPVCTECLREHINNEKAQMIKTILVGIILGVACAAFIGEPSGLLFAWVPFGWLALNAITPNIFMFMPLVGWVIYFIIKFVLSFFIGWIALPIKIYKWYRIFSSANKILN